MANGSDSSDPGLAELQSSVWTEERPRQDSRNKAIIWDVTPTAVRSCRPFLVSASLPSCSKSPLPDYKLASKKSWVRFRAVAGKRKRDIFQKLLMCVLKIKGGLETYFLGRECYFCSRAQKLPGSPQSKREIDVSWKFLKKNSSITPQCDHD